MLRLGTAEPTQILCQIVTAIDAINISDIDVIITSIIVSGTNGIVTSINLSGSNVIVTLALHTVSMLAPRFWRGFCGSNNDPFHKHCRGRSSMGNQPVLIMAGGTMLKVSAQKCPPLLWLLALV